MSRHFQRRNALINAGLGVVIIGCTYLLRLDATAQILVLFASGSLVYAAFPWIEYHFHD